MPGLRGGPLPAAAARREGPRAGREAAGGGSAAGGLGEGGGASFWKVLWVWGGRGGAGPPFKEQNILPGSARLGFGSSFRDGAVCGEWALPCWRPLP